MSRRNSPGFLLAVLGLCAALPVSVARAESVEIKNHSFEHPSFTTGHDGYGIPDWAVDGPANGAGGWNPAQKQTGCGQPDAFLDGITDGDRIAWSNASDIYKTLPVTITEGHSYTITVAVGRRCNSRQIEYSVGMFQDETLLDRHISTTDQPGWTDVTVSYTSPAGDPNAGKPITLYLRNRSKEAQINWDNVRVDVVNVGAKTAVLQAMNIIGLKGLPVSNFQLSGGTISADVTFAGKTLSVAFSKNAKGRPIGNVTTKGVTLADLIDTPGLPGLDDVTLDSITFNDHQWLLHGTFKGQNGYLYVQPNPNPGGGHYIAAYLYDLNLGNVIPGAAGTPMQDISFSNLVLFYNPSGGDVPWPDAHISGDAGPWIEQSSPDGVTLHAGMNVFGFAHIEPGGAVKSLLEKVGVSEVKFPLRGGLSKDLMHGNPGASLTSEILGALDINVDVPGMNIPGVPGDITIQSTHLAIVGDADKNTVDVNVGGFMDTTVAGTALDFKFDVDFVVRSGRNILGINAKETKDSSLTVNLGQTFTLTDIAFQMDNADSGLWTTRVSGDATVNGTAIDVMYAKIQNQGPFLAVNTKGLTVGTLTGKQDLPGIDDVVLDKITYFGAHNGLPAYTVVKGDVKGIPTSMQIQAGGGGHYVIVSMGDFDLGQVLPGAANSPLKDVDFSNLVLVYSPAPYNATMTRSGIVMDAQSWLQGSAQNPMIKSGMNIFGHVTATAGGEMKTLLEKVGVSDVTFPLNGTVSKDMFHGSPTAAIKTEILNALDVQIDVPTVKIPDLPGSVNVQNTHLAIVGDADAGSVEVDVTGVLDTTVDGKKLDFDFEVDIVIKNGTDTLTIKGKETAGSTLSVPSIIPITLTDLSFEMDNTDPAGWKESVSGTVKLKSKAVQVSYAKAPGQGYTAEIDPKGVTLADLIDSPGLPGLDDVELISIALQRNQWLLHGTFKGQNGYLYVQPNPNSGGGHYIAAYLYDLNLGDVIPGASSSLLNKVDFSNLVLFHNPTGGDIPWPDVHITGDAGPWIEQSNPDGVTIHKGMNVFGFAHVQTGGDLKEILEKVGISEVKFPLTGRIGKDLLHGNPGSAIEDAILSALDIHMPIPTPKVPGLDDVMTLSNGNLHVTGTLPGGSHGIEVEVSADTTLSVGSDSHTFTIDVEYEVPQGGGAKQLIIDGHSDGDWNKPFGISWVDLKSLGVNAHETTTDGTSEWDVTFTAKTDIGSHSNLDVTIDVTKENGQFTGSEISLTGPLDLSEIPGIKDIPEVNDLSITSVSASTHGIDAKTTFHGAPTDFFAFEASGDWVVAFAQKDFFISELITPLDSTPLKGLKLSEAAIILAKNQLNGTVSSFGPIAQDAFKVIYGDGADDDISLAQGINLISAFKHTESTGTVGSGFSRLGLKDERVILTGDIGGILGNTNPHVNLTANISLSGNPKHMRSGSKVSNHEDLVFSIIATEITKGDFDVEIGIGVDVDMTIGDDELVFGGKVGLEFQDEKTDVKFLLKLKTADLSSGKPKDNGIYCTLKNSGTFKPTPGPAGWHDPFGIPGFTLYDVIMDMAIDDDGSLHLGFAGGAKIGDDRFCVAADTDIVPELEGLPKDIAFIGAADHVEAEFLQNLGFQVAEDLLRKAGGGAEATYLADARKVQQMLNGLPQPEYKNVAFGFVTPGAVDPDLNITQEGVALKGELFWLGKELGTVNLDVGPTTGIKVHSTIGDAQGNLSIGPLTVKNTFLDFKVPLPPGGNPLNGHFKLNGDVEIPAIDLTDTVEIDITSQEMTFSASQTLFTDFSDTITLALTGVDLSLTHPPMESADFAVSAALKADFGTFIKTAMKTTLNTLFSDLDAFYQSGLQTVEDDKATVESWTKQIQAERAKVRAEQQKVEQKVAAAKDKVDKLQTDIDHAWHKYHSCHWYNAAWCKPRWAITIAAEKVAKTVADAVLDAFEKLVEHFPIDLDPRVWSLIASKDLAVEALNVAEFAIKGLEDIDGFLTKGLDAVESFAGGSVNVNKASFSGDLGDIIDGKPVDLFIDVTLFGTEFSDSFAFTLENAADELADLGEDFAKDAEKDLAHLSLLGYVGVYHMFDKVLDDIPDIFKRQLSHHLGQKLGDAQAAAKKAFEAHEVDFAKYGQTAQKLQETISTFSDTFAQSVIANPPPNPLDHEPASQTFSNDQIEIGRSGLCLGGRQYKHYGQFDSCLPAGNGDQDRQKVSTETVNWASGKNKGKDSGYVKIVKQGACLTIGGKWVTGEVDYGPTGNQHMVWQTYFSPHTDRSTQYGYPGWNTCADTEEFHWKILKHGDGFVQFHNRATQTCMWMNISEDQYGNINEILEMIPCAGARTQVFRVAPASSQAVLHSLGLPLVRAFQLGAPSDDPSQGALNCVGTSYAGSGEADATGYGNCATPYKANDYNAQFGYDAFDYYTDGLNRRRYKSTRRSGYCLRYVGVPGVYELKDTTAFDSQTCDSTDPDEWMVATQVIGGLRLQTAALKTALTVADTLTDPVLIYVQPLNSNAGATWKTVQGTSGAGSDTWNVAYTSAEQAASAIQSRASAWSAIKTALDGKASVLSQGKQACVKSGGKSLCYLLAPPTGYVPDSTDPTKLAFPDLYEYKDYVQKQASIIDDDIGMALKNALPNVTPIAEPVWNICRGQGNFGDDQGGGVYFLPGVTKNSFECYYAIQGSKLLDDVGKNQVLEKQTDLFWQPAGAGYMPASAFPTGRYAFDRTAKVFVGITSSQWVTAYDSRAVFTCRAMVGRTTRIGWTAAGRYCHIIDGTGGAVVEHFEVLTLNGSIAAPLPAAASSGMPIPCTKDDVKQYHSDQGYTPACTTAMYNQQNPGCNLRWESAFFGTFLESDC